MFNMGLYLRLIFILVHIKPFCCQHLDDGKIDTEMKDVTPTLSSVMNATVPSDFGVDVNNTSKGDLGNAMNETILNSGIVNETDIDYEYNDTATEVANETFDLPTTEAQTTSGPMFENKLIIEDFCTCDLKVGFCDINCCCDRDCSADDRKVFSRCQVRPQDVLDTRYCFQKQIIFSNYTEYKVEYLQGGVLCIMTDNFPERTMYTTLKGAKSVEDYEQLERNKRYYSWEHTFPSMQFTKAPYSFGLPVWGVNSEGFLFNIGIPNSVIGSECEAMESLHYLEDIQSSCNRVFHHVAEECLINFDLNAIKFLSFSVVADPSNHQTLSKNITSKSTSSLPITSTNSTQESSNDASSSNERNLTHGDESLNHSDSEQNLKESMNKSEENESWIMNTNSDNLPIELQDLDNLYEGQLLSPRIFLCNLENNEEHCKETKITDIPQPVFTFGACKNVVSHIHYTFVHNGTQGIYDVQARVFLTDVNELMTHSTQNFRIQYLWAEAGYVFKRSGRPGYITGKPILLGKMEGNITEEGELKNAISLDTDPGQWLTILAAGKGGGCDARSQVTFGMGMRSGCTVQVNQDDLKNCQMIQHRFLQLLLGPILRDPSGLYVATYGDSSINKAADWIPILVPEEPRSTSFLGHVPGKRKCSELTLSLHIEIAYSLQGALANPQAKVVGTVLRYGEPQSIELACVSRGCQNETHAIELVSSVSFVEVTAPPQPAYSQPPALDAKLPYDFFYPFLSSSAPILQNESFLIWVIWCCIWCLFN